MHLLSVRRCVVSILQSAGAMMDHTYKVRNTDVTELTMTFQKDMLQKECEDLVLQAVTREDEDKEMMCEDILEELICDIFGVDPPTESQKIVRDVMGDIGDEAVETAENLMKGRRRGGVILDSKGRPAKKHFSIFDEVPEDLIEKRRSTRKVLTGTQPSFANSADSSQEVISR